MNDSHTTGESKLRARQTWRQKECRPTGERAYEQDNHMWWEARTKTYGSESREDNPHPHRATVLTLTARALALSRHDVFLHGFPSILAGATTRLTDLVYELGFKGGNISVSKKTINTAIRGNTSGKVIDNGRDGRFASQTVVQ